MPYLMFIKIKLKAIRLQLKKIIIKPDSGPQKKITGDPMR